jgi:hypothetical protein
VTPDQIVKALAQHDTRIGIDEGRFCLICASGMRPPDELIQAAREAQAALQEIAEAARDAAITAPIRLDWIRLLQNLGASLEDAPKLVSRVYESAGLPGSPQRERVGEIIADIANLHLSNQIKLTLLTNKIHKMEEERAGRDAILGALRDGSLRRAQVIKAVGGTRDIVTRRLERMLRDGEIVQPSHGTYALPQHVTTPYTPTDKAIIKAFLTLPDRRGTIPQLMAITHRERIPIYDNAKRMAKEGLLNRLTSGHGVVAVFELSQAVFLQIERGEPIRLGSEFVSFELPPPSAVSAPEVLNDRRSIRALTARPAVPLPPRTGAPNE